MRHAQANQGFSVWEPLTIRHGLNTFNHAETSKSYCSSPFFISGPHGPPPADYACSGGLTPQSTVHNGRHLWGLSLYIYTELKLTTTFCTPRRLRLFGGASPPQSTVHNGRHLWGLWPYFFITQQLTFSYFRLITQVPTFV